MTTPTLDLLCELIARPSVTPADHGCQALIAQRLQAAGFACTHLRFGEVDNLWAVHDAGIAGPTVVLAGHTDVVPTGPHEAWSSAPFTPTQRDGLLFGRGAADMKASIAAFVVAAERLVAAQPQHPGRIALLLTSDEEGPSVDGTVRVVAWLRERGERLDACIVGEPTCVAQLGDMVKNGRRGSLTGRLTVLGKQGHVAYPQLADNPVHRLAPALAELCSTAWDNGNAHFGATSFQVSNIHAGTGAGNVIAGTCTVDFNFRFSTESTPEGLQARVAEVLARHGLRHELVWTLGGRPFLTPQGPLVAAMRAAIAEETGVAAACSTTGGTSDGRFIATLCPEVVEFGPVNASIHQVDEHVRVADVEPLARIYGRAVARLWQAVADGHTRQSPP